MLEEASDELDSIECHYLLLVAIGRIAPPESHLAAFTRNQATTRYGDSVRVTRQVFQHELWPSERSLCVDDPLQAFQLRDQSPECGGVSEVHDRARQPEFSGTPCCTEQIKKSLSKPAAEYTHRQEEPLPAVNPARAIIGQTACRHQAVQVRMQTKFLIPTVQNSRETNSGAHALGIGCDCK